MCVLSSKGKSAFGNNRLAQWNCLWIICNNGHTVRFRTTFAEMKLDLSQTFGFCLLNTGSVFTKWLYTRRRVNNEKPGLTKQYLPSGNVKVTQWKGE